jgi:hypothetical protein
MANVKITIDGKGVDKPFLVLQLKSYYWTRETYLEHSRRFFI